MDALINAVPYLVLFLAIAWTSWRVGSMCAYISAWFIGAGSLAYTFVNGFLQDTWYMWALTAGLFLTGYLRDRVKPT
jgi:hypothetical protein